MTAPTAMRRRVARAAGVLGGVVLLLAALLAWLAWQAWHSDDGDDGDGPTAASIRAAVDPATLVARGAYLARAGNCRSCHTAEGGADYAGGVAVDTPFGAVVAPNITPDPRSGIGAWSSADFWRALHHGRSKDGRLLYPAFPYPNYTHVTREDADALHAFLRTVPAVARTNQPHRLRFPFDTQAALAAWRALYFTPGALTPVPGESDEWHRGRYLVQGLGHCAACHSGRDLLGGTSRDAAFTGGPMPDGRWLAPSLASPREAGLQGWPRDEAVRLLRDGVSSHGAVSGPMADVVFESTQYLHDDDLAAMARYLSSLPERPVAAPTIEPAPAFALARGDGLYRQHCAGCHGDRGQGVAGIYPALAGNRAVTMPAPRNVVQMIRQGGFSPATRGNPRPFGMPPFGQVLGNDDQAALATFIRQSWGNRAPAVSAIDAANVR